MIDKTKILLQVSQQLETWLDYRKPRFDQIKKVEDMYFGKTLPALKGRFNIPVPILEGYVETLESKIDDQISIQFKKSRESTLKIAKKLNAAWEHDSSPDNGAYNEADLDAKKLAIFSGFGFLELIPTSKPSYKQELRAIDYWDVIAEPYGGRDLEKHLFKGRMNVPYTKQQLLDGVKDGRFISEEVKNLINNVSESEMNDVQDEFQGKLNRYIAMGLNPEQYNYIGDGVYNLVSMVSRFDGDDYYVLFSYDKQKLIQYEKLSKIFTTGLSPWTAWHTRRNPVSFLSRTDTDSIYPVAEAMRTLINQNFDNINKRNWDMVLYNAKKIMNPRQLAWRPNGLIEVKLQGNESMDNAYRKMETPDTSSITVNLVQYLNSFLGEKTGVTPGAMGNAEEDKVGIYYGNVQQAADRYGMLNKFYRQAHVEIAKRWKGNLYDHMPSRGYMVKMLGLRGYQDEELTREEVKENLGIEIVSANVEAQQDTITQKKQENAIDRILKTPELKAQVGQKWLLRNVLKIGEFSEEEIRDAMSGEEGGDNELISEAARAVELIREGEEPKLNRGANTAFIRWIINYAMDESDNLDDATFNRIYKYAVDHLSIAQQNAQLLTITQPTNEQIAQQQGSTTGPIGQLDSSVPQPAIPRGPGTNQGVA